MSAAMRPYLQAEWNQSDVSVSPDGEWAAFTSSESGVAEVMVRRFPVGDAGGVWKVSTGGAQRPRWSGDGRTIYYQALDNTIRVVHVTPGPSFSAGRSEDVIAVSGLGPGWDVDRSKGRVVLTEQVGSANARIIVMQNWLARFERDVALKGK